MISYHMGCLDSICDDDMIVDYAEVSFWLLWCMIALIL